MVEEFLNKIDTNWTLFLDRDGVINKRLPNDYVKHISEFEFLPEVLEGIGILSRYFGVIVVVTNQQGIGKGIMTEEALLGIHQYMLSEVFAHGGRIDHVFYCPELASTDAPCRKPNTGMAFQAKAMFPEIDFKNTVMVGDSPSDIKFGNRIGAQCIGIGREADAELSFLSLIDFARALEQIKKQHDDHN